MRGGNYYPAGTTGSDIDRAMTPREPLNDLWCNICGKDLFEEELVGHLAMDHESIFAEFIIEVEIDMSNWGYVEPTIYGWVIEDNGEGIAGKGCKTVYPTYNDAYEQLFKEYGDEFKEKYGKDNY